MEWEINWDQLGMYQKEPPLPYQGHTLASSRLRINLNGEFINHWEWECAYEQTGIWQKRLISPSIPEYLRVDDFNANLHEGENSEWRHQLDRFSLRKQWHNFKFSIGRQAIGHGNGRFFNPTDIFSPLTPYSLSTQYKRGIDAIRGAWHSAGLVFEGIHVFNGVGPDMDLFRAGGNVRGVDLSAYLGKSWSEWTFGFDSAWTWRESAVYSEWLLRQGNNRDNTLRGMGGIQRSFGGKWDVLLEAQYNQNGKSLLNPQDWLESKEVNWGELFFLGRFHTAMSVSLEATPLIIIGTQWLHDFSGESDWFVLSMDWDITSQSQIRFGLMTTNGDSQSDFGNYSDTAYAEWRWTL